jgi:hypothetical protein
MRRDALIVYLKRLVVAAVPAVTLTACPLFGGPCGGEETRYRTVDAAGSGDGGAAEILPVDDAGDLSDGGCAQLCSFTYASYIKSCELATLDGGQSGIACNVHYQCIGGRRPAGLAAARANEDGTVGAWFARMAHLEDASVAAFLRLADELSAQGAPRALVTAARAAAGDEVRHARETGRLARRFGATAERARVERIAPRSLEAIAVENAAEGCVGETWGALVALHQARAAGDPLVRDALGRIADDEAGHAQLSWRIDAWARTRLDGAARRRVDEARRAAAAELGRSLDERPPAELRALAGLPDRAVARALHAELARTLWAA